MAPDQIVTSNPDLHKTGGFVRPEIITPVEAPKMPYGSRKHIMIETNQLNDTSSAGSMLDSGRASSLKNSLKKKAFRGRNKSQIAPNLDNKSSLFQY